MSAPDGSKAAHIFPTNKHSLRWSKVFRILSNHQLERNKRLASWLRKIRNARVSAKSRGANDLQITMMDNDIYRNDTKMPKTIKSLHKAPRKKYF